jgi:hypothetical protein
MKIIISLICLVVILNGAIGQSYTPFPTNNAEWIVKHTNAGNGGPPSSSYFSYEMQGDTLLNDTLYHKMYYSSMWNPDGNILSAGLREENRRVYFRRMGDLGISNVCVNWVDQEFLIYDFNIDEVGDSLYLPTQEGMSLFVAQSIDSILVNGTYRTRWNFSPYQDMCQPFWYTYIEGIGSDRHPFGHIVWMTQESSDLLSCMTNNGQFEYSAYPVPPLCDLADYVSVNETNTTEPKLFMNGTLLVLDQSYDWKDTHLEIFSSSGQRVFDQYQTEAQYDLASWVSGLYIVKVQMSDGSIFKTKVIR